MKQERPWPPSAACRGRAFALLLALALVAGCRASIPTPLPLTALRPVPLPNLTGLDGDVQAQIQAEHARVAEIAGRSAAQPNEIGEAYGGLGQILLAYRLDNAEAALANARDLAPGDARWPYYLGRLHQDGGQLETALADFARADEIRPDDIPTRVRLAQVNLDLGRADEAGRWLDEVLAKEPDHALAHALLGEVSAAQSDDAAAVEHFSRALALDPSATRLHYMLGIAYRNLGDTQKSREHLALRGDTPVRMDDPLGDVLDALKKGSGLLVFLAGLAQREGEIDVAVVLYERAIAEDPADAIAHLNLGAVLVRRGDLERAIGEMETAARLAPDDADVHQSLGSVLMRAHEAEKAETALRRSVDLDPQSSGARLALADLLRLTGRCAEAIPLFVEGLERDPSQVSARVQQALCHGRLGEWPAARALLETNATAFPGNPDALDALARLLAAAPDDSVRDGRRALTLAGQAIALRRSADTVETLAMAHAELGQWDLATRMQEEAIGLAEKGDYPDWLAVLRANLELYARRQPNRLPWPEFLFRL